MIYFIRFILYHFFYNIWIYIIFINIIYINPFKINPNSFNPLLVVNKNILWRYKSSKVWFPSLIFLYFYLVVNFTILSLILFILSIIKSPNDTIITYLHFYIIAIDYIIFFTHKKRIIILIILFTINGINISLYV